MLEETEAVTSDNLIDTVAEVKEDTWQTQYLSEDLQGNDTLSKFKDVGSLGNSYVELQKLVGSRVKVPTDDSTEEDVNSFYNQIGRPESPEKYSIDLPSDSYPQEVIQSFLKEAHASGLTNKQAQAAINFYNTIETDGQINSDAAMQQAKVDAESALKKEWGPSEYAKELAVSRRAFNRFADDDLKAFVNETGVTNNVAMIKFLNRIGKAFSEPDMGGAGKDSGSIDGDSAKIEIAAMLKDTSHKYNEALFDNTHPKHAEAMSYRDHLYDIVYAEDE
jgi:hypothetical protein|tara:strand:+ start:5388 stop:6218 length:831 start_codon:yes stop_codon:yes gene_type:complete